MRVFLQIIALIVLVIIAILLFAAAKTFIPKHPGVAILDMNATTTNTVATSTNATSTAVTNNIDDLIHIKSPKEGSVITSPLKVTGEARGSWYFEASFPVVVVDWDGRIIGQGHVQAKGDWMTTDFVPFEGTIEFTKPECAGGTDYCKRGAIIFKNDNPSGQASTSFAVEIPINFK